MRQKIGLQQKNLLALLNDTCFGFIIHKCLIFVQQSLPDIKFVPSLGFVTTHVR